ncbi:MAG: iron-containing alcohol dehydrogenase [Bacteroidota bacterium]
MNSDNMNFDFKTPRRIISEPGCSADSSFFASLQLRGKILLVTDATLVKLGIATKVLEALVAANLEVIVFDQVEPEPKVETVRKALDFVKAESIDTVIGLGGGSPMDIAKILALLLKTPQEISTLYGVGNCRGDRLPLVLIPTTAGTGSEVTHVAVVTGDDGEKSPIVDAILICDTVLLDATLTIGLPPRITAATGIDAMVHAMEAFTSGLRKNIVSDQLAIDAFQLLYNNISEAVHNGTNLQARQAMLTGSMLAGLAFANATVGAVHALSYPLGAQYHLPHGESNALVMVPVMRFNGQKAFPLYAALCKVVHPDQSQLDEKALSNYLLDQIATLIPSLGLPTRLSAYGIGKQDLNALVVGTLHQARLLSYNYTPMEKVDIHAVFEGLL